MKITISSLGAGLQPETTERKGTIYQAITSGFKCDGQGLLPWLASFSAPLKAVQSGNLLAVKSCFIHWKACFSSRFSI